MLFSTLLICAEAIHCLSFVAILPDVLIEDAEDRLVHLADLAKRMEDALIIAAGTFYYKDPSIDSTLEDLLKRLQNCPKRLSDWQYSTAFEGAWMILALVRAHYPRVNLHELVRTTPLGLEPEMFFDVVKDDAKYIVDACDLEKIIEDSNRHVL